MLRMPLALLICGSLLASAFAQLNPGPTAAEKRRIAFWKSVGSTSKQRFLAASKLKPGQRVDDLQASLLAYAYFHVNLGACGSPGHPVDKGSFWLFPTAVGYEGDPGPDIRVVKATGATGCKVYKTITDPRVYAKWAK